MLFSSRRIGSALQNVVYPLDQSRGCKRLRKHGFYAQRMCLGCDLMRRQRGHKDRGELVPPVAQLLQNGKAALVRQSVVKHKHVRLVQMDRLHQVMPIMGEKHMKIAVDVESVPQKCTEALVVVGK